jgi:hypothetical protein
MLNLKTFIIFFGALLLTTTFAFAGENDYFAAPMNTSTADSIVLADEGVSPALHINATTTDELRAQIKDTTAYLLLNKLVGNETMSVYYEHDFVKAIDSMVHGKFEIVENRKKYLVYRHTPTLYYTQKGSVRDNKRLQFRTPSNYSWEDEVFTVVLYNTTVSEVQVQKYNPYNPQLPRKILSGVAVPLGEEQVKSQ